MHLLVLSAFRPICGTMWMTGSIAGLNAPSGAQCFPTRRAYLDVAGIDSLNAPSGAQCFPTQVSDLGESPALPVSMHLLVLSAFRP